jgi:hypothetical protein
MKDESQRRGLETLPPHWDKGDPRGSLLRHGAWLSEKARRLFLTDGFHTELVFFLSSDGRGAVIQPPRGMDRDRFVAFLKDTIRRNGIYGVIHIVEAWTYFPRKRDDHTMQQVLAGEIAVSQLGAQDRTEALMVRVDCRDGSQRLWLSAIVRSPTGVALADVMEMREPLGGRFGRLFENSRG